MTGWEIHVSFDGKAFASIDSKNEMFCSSIIHYPNSTDCGEITTRTFSLPPFLIRKIKLWMTKPDSTGTHWLSPSHIDFYISHSNSICQPQYTIYRPFLFIFLLLNKQ